MRVRPWPHAAAPASTLVASGYAKLKGLHMKRRLGLLLVMGMVGCGGGSGTEPAKTLDAATVKKQMTPAQLALGDPVVNSVGLLLVPIPAGTFMMGSPEEETYRRGNEHQHKVTISKSFYMQTTEVTQGQWKAVMGTEPWKRKRLYPIASIKVGANYAATSVSWDDAVAYCKKLSEKEGKTYRLRTEAEWEYACRAGTKTMWSFGNDEKALGDYAWYRENAYSAGERVCSPS